MGFLINFVAFRTDPDVMNISLNFTKFREIISYQVVILDRCLCYTTQNSYIGCKRYVKTNDYISVTPYSYSA